MKKTFTAGLAFLLGMAVGAQYVPDRLNYQAILTDHDGTPRVSATNTVRLRIYDEAEGGNLVWGEAHSVTTSPRGLFSVVLGNGVALGEHTEAANLRGAFASGTLVEQRYLELQVLNADGSAQSPILPRQRFLTVPYAFQANDAQKASGNFTVSGALYADSVGVQVGRLVMTNSLCSLSAAGDLKMDGLGAANVTASFGSTSSVRSTDAQAVRVASNLTANQDFTVSGAGVFSRGVSARNPTFEKGVSVKGGVRALGDYHRLGTNLTSLSSRSAAGDGFALVYFKTEGWGDDADLVVTVGTNKYPMQHHPSSVGDYHSLHFWDTACIPVGKGTSWSVAFTNGSYSHSKFDVYWIPFGY